MADKKILIVDDEPDIVETLQFRLEKEGYQVITANDGVEALELAHLEKPDLITLDIVLPKMDGYQVCRALKESGKEEFSKIPVILITAKVQLVDEKIQAVSGADDFVVKPFDAEDILSKIKNFLS